MVYEELGRFSFSWPMGISYLEAYFQSMGLRTMIPIEVSSLMHMIKFMTWRPTRRGTHYREQVAIFSKQTNKAYNKTVRHWTPRVDNLVKNSRHVQKGLSASKLAQKWEGRHIMREWLFRPVLKVEARWDWSLSYRGRKKVADLKKKGLRGMFVVAGGVEV